MSDLSDKRRRGRVSLAVAVICFGFGGMLVGGVAGGLLVNWWTDNARMAYEDGAVRFLQVKNDIAKGDPIRESNLNEVVIPRALAPSFSQAVRADAAGRTVITGRPASRRLLAGEFLWYADFASGGP